MAIGAPISRTRKNKYGGKKTSTGHFWHISPVIWQWGLQFHAQSISSAQTATSADIIL